MTKPAYTFRDAQLRSPLLKTVNALGSGLAAAGLRLPALAPASIIAAANKRSGGMHNAVGDPDKATQEALARYINSADTEANLNTLGRMAVRNMLVGGLASRFAVLDWHRRYPDLADESIKAPWIIIGLPRTGTSILSILLGLDPFNRPLLQWEARSPIPPSTLATAAEDPRIGQLSREFAQLRKLNPAAATMHPFGSTLAEECTAVFTYSLRTVGMETVAFTPSYGTWLDAADMTPSYAIHKRTLQALQRAQPTAHWVLKSPNHLWCLPSLLTAYPDARIIWTHRDPIKVMPSLASLNCAMQMQFTRKLVPQVVGDYWLHRIQRVLEQAIAFDDEKGAGWCCHVQYQELMRDPAATLASIYSHFGASLSDLHRQRVSAWLQQRPQHADGVHVYDIKDFGWDKDTMQKGFKAYQQRYAIPWEE